MRIFLIQASQYSPQTERSMPLGLLYLASFLREKRKCAVGLHDMQLLEKSPQPAVAAALDFMPELIAISGMTADARVIDELATALKCALPDVPLVVGGAHATNYTEQVIANPAVDSVIVNEGELALAAYIDHLVAGQASAQVPNLVFREEGKIVRSPAAEYIDDLDALPFPAFDLLDLEAYYRLPRCGVIYRHRRYAAIISSRGCPYRCAYCHQIHGKKWRARSAANVLDEMESLRARYEVRDFVFMDDLFNLSVERVEAIAQGILDRRLSIGLHFPIGLRGDIMTENSVRLLKDAGMYRCMYAVETASERLQNEIGKNNNLTKLKHIIDFTRRQGILVHGSFMLGFPTETEKEARATIDFALHSRLHTAAFYRVVPFQGTRLHQMAIAAGSVMPNDLSRYEFHIANNINISAMSDRMLSHLKRLAYRRFYLSPWRIFAILRDMPNRWRLLPNLLLIWVRKSFIW